MMEYCLREKSTSIHFIVVSLQNGARVVSRERLTRSYLKNTFSKDIERDQKHKMGYKELNWIKKSNFDDYSLKTLLTNEKLRSLLRS